MHNKPRRSSIRLYPEPLKNDSVYEPNTRRVSFSRTIVVCGAEMEVSQLPLSRVSDESTEVTKSDGWTVVPSNISIPDMSMDMEQLDRFGTETSSSALTEITKPDETQSMLPDSVACDMSIEQALEVSNDCNPKMQTPEEADSSVEMSVCSDPTPKKTANSIGAPSQTTKPTHCEMEMDISVCPAEPVCKQSQPTVSHPSLNFPNSDDALVDEVSNLISPIPYRKSEMSPIVEGDVQDTRIQNRSPTETDTGENSLTLITAEENESAQRLLHSHFDSGANDKDACVVHSPVHDHETIKDGPNFAHVTPILSLEARELHLRSSNRRLLCSLPPLRPDRTADHIKAMPLGDSKVCHTLIGTRNESSHRKQFSSRLGLKMDNRIMSQSLATTPLRQVTPRDWIQATAIQRGDSLSKYGGVHRYEPEYLMPSVSRLQGQVMRLTAYPVLEHTDLHMGTNLRNLQQFLDHNANILMDKENISSKNVSAEFERILQNQLDRTKLQEELLNHWRAVQLSTRCRVRMFTDMYQQRQSKVLLQHLPSSPVVMQLKNMSEFQRFDFIAQAHERLHQCAQQTIQEFHEIESANSEAVRTEKQSIVDAVSQLEKDLDAEMSALETELNQEKNAVKELRDVANQLKDRAAQLKSIAEETERVQTETKNVRLTNQQLSEELVKRIGQFVDDVHIRMDPVASVPGVTELYVPLNAFVGHAQSSDKKAEQEFSVQELSNKFSPADLLCLSYDDDVYAIRTLLGLVQITLKCRSIHHHTTTMTRGEASRPVIKPDKLIIQTVNVVPPSTDFAPVDCAAVQTLADFVISLCNSREGHTQFCSKLIGMNLEKAVWYIEYVMMPYFLLAGDLRAIFLNGHGVELECTPPLDATFGTPGQRSLLHRSAMSISVCADSNESKSNSSLDRNPTDRMIPAGPFNITVKLCHQKTLIVLLIRIILPTLEPDGVQLPESSIKCALGQIQSGELEQLSELCRVYPGSIYKAIQTVEQSLSTMCHT